MQYSIFLGFAFKVNRSRSVDSILFLGAVFFMAALYAPWVFSANHNALKKSEWSVCMPFTKVANTQQQITAATLERELAKFKQPEKEAVSKEKTAYLSLLSSTLAPNRSSIEQWQWSNLKRTVDKIYAGEITAKEFMIDINNNGSLEHVVEFRSLPPFTRAWNYVLDEAGEFNEDFLDRIGQPIGIIGELRIFDGETYIFDISNPVLKPESGEFSSLPFVIYRPRKSAMMKDSGISRYGVGPLCEFEVIHEQEKVR